MSAITGTIFDIKRFAIHDGPGIRSTLFLKGCSLRCPWCHNPEGLEKNIRLWHFQNKCIKCGLCKKACKYNALSINKEALHYISINHDECILCGKCISECPADALAFDGRKITVSDAIDELMKDRDFFELSGGGVTLSGGDPLFQAEFCYELLGLSKKQHVHTTIETSLYAPTKTVEKMLDVVDLFIVDIKIFDDKHHKNTIGVGNAQIKKNIELLVYRNADILFRVPLIPLYTADNDNLSEIADYIKGLRKDIPVELLNYNPLTVSKYLTINKDYQPGKDIQQFSKEDMKTFIKIFTDRSITIINERKKNDD